eukprot:COSAG03_NODE_74_length_14441_cov_13.158974_15_plen_161_part_00
MSRAQGQQRLQHGQASIVTNASRGRISHSRTLPSDELAVLEAVCWPADAAVRATCRRLWEDESLECVAEHPVHGRVGLAQGSNGPCGVLAALQARHVAQVLLLPEAGAALTEALAGCLEDAAAGTHTHTHARARARARAHTPGGLPQPFSHAKPVQQPIR